MESIEKCNGLQFHYYFNDESHSINSIIRNECEKEILLIVQEISETLGLQLEILTLPTEEGGFKDKWKLLGKNAPQLTLIIAIAVGILSRFPAENKELTPLQIENLQLDNEIKKRELEKLKLDEIENDSILNQKIISDSMTMVSKNYKISWRRSNLYKKLENYPKVDHIDVTRLQDNEPVGSVRTVERNDFSKFILRTDELPSLKVERGIIDVAAPAIKRKFRWKGFYNEVVISVLIEDNEFNNRVFNGQMHFSNRYSIEVEMTLERKINHEGNVVITNAVVHKVHAAIEGENRIDY